MKIQINVTFFCLVLVCLMSVIMLTQTVQIVAAASGDGHCKELSKLGGWRSCIINARESHKVDHKIVFNYFD